MNGWPGKDPYEDIGEEIGLKKHSGGELRKKEIEANHACKKNLINDLKKSVFREIKNKI